MPAQSQTASNVLGVIGAVCWSVPILPQIWKSWREKSTEGLSSWLMLSWFMTGPLFGSYMLLEEASIPLIVEPHACALLAAVSWTQCLFYAKKKSLRDCLLFYAALVVLGLAVELGFYYGAKAAPESKQVIVMEVAGSLATALIVFGFVPQFYEIWRFKAVIGISLPFLIIDLAGGVFNVLAVVFQPGKFNIVAAVTYLLVVVCETVILTLVPILNPRYYRQQREEELASQVSTVSSHTLIDDKLWLPPKPTRSLRRQESRASYPTYPSSSPVMDCAVDRIEVLEPAPEPAPQSKINTSTATPKPTASNWHSCRPYRTYRPGDFK